MTGGERQETTEGQAEGIVAAELKRRHWAEADLDWRPKGDAGKVAMALRLRAESAVTVRWVADRLRMGTAAMRIICCIGDEAIRKGKM